MSEADRVFSPQSKRAASHGQTRHIVTAPRKNSSGTMASRVVEVVQVRRHTSGSDKVRSPSTPWHVHVETWPDGFRARSPAPTPLQAAQPMVPKVPPPTVHVMPAWEPSVQQPALTDEKSVEAPPGIPPVEGLKRGNAKPRLPKVTARDFADPFVEADDRANCIRCGYLVEQAREARGLWTCSKCG